MGADFRSVRLEIRKQIISAIKRIVEAECAASGPPKPPVFTPTRRFPPTLNDKDVVSHVAATFATNSEDFDDDVPRTNVSEDFSTLATCRGLPSCFWLLGEINPELSDKAQGRFSHVRDPWESVGAFRARHSANDESRSGYVVPCCLVFLEESVKG